MGDSGWDVADARRITGLHPLLDGPGVGCELLGAVDGDRDAVCARLDGIFAALGLPAAPVVVRAHSRGLSVARRAPEDALSVACGALEASLGDGPVDIEVLRRQLEAEQNDALVALRTALGPGCSFWDDDGFTVGRGVHARTWPLGALPTLAVAQAAGGGIPVVMVTGTNGKTTTSRMISSIARAAGRTAGHTSSDGVVVAGEAVTRGDWTGPGAARTLLRDPRVDFAVLETARGGLMRRGLAIEGVDAVVVTNISDDHLCEWGLDDLHDMAWAKLSVARALRQGGTLVINGGDDALKQALGTALVGRDDIGVRRFGREGDDAWIADGHLMVQEGADVHRLLPVDEVPATLGGRARFNAENAMAAVLVARAVGLSLADIRAGLRGFRPTRDQSRGRLNHYTLPSGASAIVDYAHNPAGVRGFGPVAERHARVLLLAGQAGDRTDALIDRYAGALAELSPAVVVIKDLPHYRRGRAPGEVGERLRRVFERAGVPDIRDVEDEVEAAAVVLELAGPGDLCLLFVHEQLDGVEALLARLGATG